MSRIPLETKRFINAVTNPFDCSEPARIPDNDAQMSMPMKDYLIHNGLTQTVNSSTTVVSGVAYYLIVGSNALAEHSVISNAAYSVVVTLLDANGVQAGTSSMATANLTNIQSMSSFYRFVGGAIRTKCLIDDVTVSTTVAVARSYAGLVKPADIYTTLNNDTSFYNLGIQMDCLKMYGNREGATVRLDPFQQIEDFKKYRSSSDWTNYPSFNGNTYAIPMIVTQFQNPVASTVSSGNTTYTIPMIFEFIMWVEALLAKPSPLYLTSSPTDLNYQTICEVISTQCENKFPVVAKFNTFANFLASAGRLAVAAVSAVNNSSFLPITSLMKPGGRGRNKPRRKGRKMNKRPKRRNRRPTMRTQPRFQNNGNKKSFKSAQLKLKRRR